MKLLTLNAMTLCLIGIFLAVVPQNVSAQAYQLLEPTAIDGGPTAVATTQEALNYLSFAVKTFMGLIVLLSVIMIVIGGVEYMLSSIPATKTQGLRRVYAAIGGLVLALVSWLILYIINPDLVKFQLDLVRVGENVQIDQADPATTGDTGGSNTDNSTGNTQTGTPQSGRGFFLPESNDPEVEAFAQGLENGNTIQQVVVDTNTRTATITDNTGRTVTVPINIGTNGAANIGEGVSGDRRTPRGTYSLTSDQRITNDPNNAVMIAGGSANAGPAFLNIGAVDQNGNDRGIGFHGSNDNSLRPTYGCIRMRNQDLMLLSEHMGPGTRLTIN